MKSIKDLDLNAKAILVRVDYNTPIRDGVITDDGRIRASLPTLAFLLEKGCGLTLMSHMGRPKGERIMDFSLAPVARRCGELLNRDVQLVELGAARPAEGQVQVLENLRFSPGETANDPDFAAQLAKFGEVYINDAFGSAHRAHASIDAVARLFEQRAPGFLLEKEIRYLGKCLDYPERPFLAILGGAKVSDKIALIRNLIPRVDTLLIGGAMSYTFLKASGVEVGDSRVEVDFLDQASGLLRDAGEKLKLPLDHVVAKEFKHDAEASITLHADIEPGRMGLDIGPETINAYTSMIETAGTVVWNGPMGVFEWDTFSTGTITMAEALAESGALSIVGGGDSAAAVRKAEVQDRISHISTGGGASLEFLSGIELPGIKALS